MLGKISRNVRDGGAARARAGRGSAGDKGGVGDMLQCRLAAMGAAGCGGRSTTVLAEHVE